jgi:hypothetical protein
MANANGPRGLKPVRKVGGGCITLTEYSIATDATAIYTGDVVEMTGTGANVAKAAAENVDNIGVFAGCRYKAADGEIKFSAYWPGSVSATEAVALVYDDPDIVFEVQGDSVAAADVGTLVDWNVGTPNATTGLSGLYAVVNGATGLTGKGLRIMRLVPRPDNAYGAYAKIEVSFAEHALKGVVAGVGGI